MKKHVQKMNTHFKRIHTVDGRNPTPVDRWFIPLVIGFQPSKVVQDFFHPQYVSTQYTITNEPKSVVHVNYQRAQGLHTKRQILWDEIPISGESLLEPSNRW